jgi:ribosome-binding protein aMBF1 (putative translation factor)
MIRVTTKITCKLCGKKEKNQIRQSNIVVVTCSDCRRAMFSAKTLRAQARKAKQVEKTTVKETKTIPEKKESVKTPVQDKGYKTLYSFSKLRET